MSATSATLGGLPACRRRCRRGGDADCAAMRPARPCTASCGPTRARPRSPDGRVGCRCRIERRHAHQGGDPLAIEVPEFRQLRQQRARRGRPDARHAFEQVFLHAPDRAGLDGPGQIIVNVAEADARANECASASHGAPAWSSPATKRRCSAPSMSSSWRRRATQRGQRLRGRIGHGPRRTAAPRAPNSASSCASSASVFAGARRAWAYARTWRGLTTATRRPAPAHAAARRGFVAARRFEHDQRRGQRRKARHEAIQRGGGRGAGPRVSARVHGMVPAPIC